MNIFLMGYMGCGKSSVGKALATALTYDFIDFDAYIEEKEQAAVSEIFKNKGEIYFRKLETACLKELLLDRNDKTVVSLGGGTPCYGNNLQMLQSNEALLLYLNTSVQELTKRLWNERENRPLISAQSSYENLEEFVRKHLFERAYYYNQAMQVVKTDGKSIQTITEEIVDSLF